MNEILYANIFFIIASVASVVFLVFLCVILFNVIKILHLIRAILNRIDSGSRVLGEDIAKMRSSLYNGGIFSWLFNLFFKKTEVKKVVSKKSVATKRNLKTKIRSKKL